MIRSTHDLNPRLGHTSLVDSLDWRKGRLQAVVIKVDALSQ